MSAVKLNKGFITHNDGDETILVSTGASKFSGLVRSNETAGFIIECLENDITEAEIVAKMQEKYDGSKETMERDVKNVVAQLKKIGAIDD